MRKITLIASLIILTGCSTLQMADYIKPEHPYVRKVSGQYADIVGAAKVALFKSGWELQSEINPSVYERRSGGEDQTNDVLLVTGIKQHPKVVVSTYTHLNVFIHPIAEGAEIDVRYEAYTPAAIKKFRGYRNDRLAKNILDKIEHELESN